ncbi:MAG: hypothetical protein ACTFAL_03235 [Candidatus Electronema sp. V4]|uniref:hypothetical protein n=1 Tax=Candidatus Electronema sp. V4 TaxID=3454756 RepID=UPI004055545F
MKIRHFITVSVAVALGGCQICTDCEPVDYVLDSSDTFYADSSYSSGESAVFTEDDGVWTEGETWTEDPGLTTLDYIPSYYSGGESAVFTEDEVWTENAVPTLDYIPSSAFSSSSSYYYSVPTQSYRTWRNFGRQLPYSVPRFTTPPMQSIIYPTETYYPFKRPSPGVYMPGRNTYYQDYSVPTYRPMPYFY